MSTSNSLRLTDCTMNTLQELQLDLVRELQGSGPVSLDRSGVQRPNTAVLQLLAAFVRDLHEKSRPVEWTGQSEAFDRAASALGLSAALGLPAAA